MQQNARKLLSLQEYEKIASNIVYKIFIIRKIPIENETIGEAIHAVIKADLQYDGKISIERYRKLWVQWHLSDYLRRRRNKFYQKINRRDEDNKEALDYQYKKQKTALELLILKEQAYFYLNQPEVSERNKYILEKYFLDGYTLQEIGEEFSLTKQRVSQIISSTIKKISQTKRGQE